jgi:hypothetical protein
MDIDSPAAPGLVGRRWQTAATFTAAADEFPGV